MSSSCEQRFQHRGKIPSGFFQNSEAVPSFSKNSKMDSRTSRKKTAVVCHANTHSNLFSVSLRPHTNHLSLVKSPPPFVFCNGSLQLYYFPHKSKVYALYKYFLLWLYFDHLMSQVFKENTTNTVVIVLH